MARIVIRSLVVLAVLLCVTACRSHVANVYSGVDPAVSPPLKNDPILFVMPQDPSIRERNLAILLREELIRNGFNIVADSIASKWTLSFAVNRRTYTIGSTTQATAVQFGAIAVGSANTTYIQQTDVTIFMHLFRTADLENKKPITLWEGSVTTNERAFSAMPNSTIKNLLDKFGLNFERPTRLDRKYQRAINVQKAPK